jgi:hypothetical protein
MRGFAAPVGLVLGLAFFGGKALAQGAPLPPLPVTEPQPEAPPPPPPAPSGDTPQPPGPPPPPGQPPLLPPGTIYVAPPPPPPVLVMTPVIPRKHAPAFSLWTGGRLGLLGFGGFFYTNQLGQGETTGNFVTPGLSVEANVGARLGGHYTPYLFWEHGFVAAGHRFEGETATAATDFRGLGFRYSLGNVDSVAFLSDLAVGLRTISVTAGGSTYKMSAWEIFRFGLGAEVRLTTLVTLSPLAWVSGGTMNDTSGSVTYGPGGQGDGLTSPTYVNGQSINAQRSYVSVGVECGAHFDLFGK